MAPSTESPADIPTFAKPLAPYIKSRQDALHIRQALTSYLCSFIVCADGTGQSPVSHDFLPQCTPSEAVTDLKRIPANLTGLRKDYLTALQANVAARKSLKQASDDVAALRRQAVPTKHSDKPADVARPAAGLQDYLQLLRERQRQAKLSDFQKYLYELKTKDAGSLGEPDIAETAHPLMSSISHADEDDTSARGHAGEPVTARVDDLVYELERAVVRARMQLDTERRLFEEVQSRHALRSRASVEEVAPEVKIRALQRTRDELVQWVEERLVSEGDPDEGLIPDLTPEELEETQRRLEHQRSQISEQYTAYLQARQSLLEAASRACQPVTVAREPPQCAAPRTEMVPPSVRGPDPLGVLSWATDALIPLSQRQRALALQRSYVTGLLAKERSSTLRVLHRLSDESHLLPEYPMPARQPRSKYASGARTLGHSPQPVDTAPPDEILEMARAWAFASEAAMSHERDFVQQKLILGNEVARDARTLLGDAYSTLNQDMPQALGNGSTKSTERLKGQFSRRAATQSSRMLDTPNDPNGPWSSLNGRVGDE